jgi:hypothetical protein
MSTQEAKDRLELLQGTLDLLILRTLIFRSQHGQGIARAIQQKRPKRSFLSNTARCILHCNDWKRRAGSLPNGELR